MKITVPKVIENVIVGTAIALATVTLLGMLVGTAHADINNPHSTPPNNSITAPMLRSGIVSDVAVSPSAAIQLLKLGTSADTGLTLFGGATGVATDSPFAYNSATHTLRTTGLITGQASTTLNNVPYTLPSSQGAASTVLTNNGSGSLSWSASTAATILLATTSTAGVSWNNATTTTFFYPVPANTIGNHDTLHIHMLGYTDNCGTTRNMEMIIGNGSASSSLMSIVPTGNINSVSTFDLYLSEQGANNSQNLDGTAWPQTSTTIQTSDLTSSYVTTSPLYVTLQYFCGTTGGVSRITSAVIEQFKGT